MLKRFLITVCCLLVTMLSIMAQEEYGNDWSLWIAPEESLIAPILLNEELNHQANSYYKKCGFNFEKECCCGCNAPPHSDFITIYPKGSYTMSKTAEKDALSRFAIPLFTPCKWPKRNFHNYRNFSFIKSCTEKLFVCDAT